MKRKEGKNKTLNCSQVQNPKIWLCKHQVMVVSHCRLIALPPHCGTILSKSAPPCVQGWRFLTLLHRSQARSRLCCWKWCDEAAFSHAVGTPLHSQKSLSLPVSHSSLPPFSQPLPAPWTACFWNFLQTVSRYQKIITKNTITIAVTSPPSKLHTLLLPTALALNQVRKIISQGHASADTWDRESGPADANPSTLTAGLAP